MDFRVYARGELVRLLLLLLVYIRRVGKRCEFAIYNGVCAAGGLFGFAGECECEREGVPWSENSLTSELCSVCTLGSCGSLINWN